MIANLLASDQRCEFDLAIAACGFESRSSDVVRSGSLVAEKRIAFGYRFNEVGAFQVNLARFLAAGYEFLALHDDEFHPTLFELVNDLGVRERKARVFVDISCFTRSRLAAIVEILAGFACDVTFSYRMAAFSEPPLTYPPNEHLGPVSEFFSGWGGDLFRPVGVVSGLGYERMQAVGILDQVDASSSWFFLARSPIREYDVAVDKANSVLLRGVSPSAVIRYKIAEFSRLVGDVVSLCGVVRNTHRCILMQLGPKTFAVSCLIAGVVYRDVGVWRASSGKNSSPVDRKGEGLPILARVAFER